MKRVLKILTGILLCGAVAAAYATSRFGYESAPYEVLLSEGKFEVRKYPSLLLAEAPMDEGMNTGFRRLFNYISGKNSTGEKISMTTPVYLEQKEQDRTMSFVMPSSFSLEKLPAANDPAVVVKEMPGGIFAVLRFSASRNSESEARVLQQLQEEMAARELPIQSAPVYAYFDPPWIPPFLRRNEVMLRTEK